MVSATGINMTSPLCARFMHFAYKNLMGMS